MNKKKILKIFNKAKKDLESKNKDHKSKHWKKYNQRLFDLKSLNSFRENGGLSDGLDDIDNANILKIYLQSVSKFSEKYIHKNLSKNNIGNSTAAIKYKNVYIDFNKLIHIHWFKDLEKIFFKKNIKNVCEIGGGYGCLSELIIKNYNIKLLSIDLPEANLMTSFYLYKNFPSKKFYLYDNYLIKEKLTYEDFNEYDIFILPPDCNIDDRIKIDLFINTRSMMEMNYNIIVKYFEFIQKYISKSGFFLNINRYEKKTVGDSIRISEYPYDNNWEVVVSKPSFHQNWVHFLMTKRQFINNKQNIKIELNKIGKLGKKYYGKYNEKLPRFLNIKYYFKTFLKLIFSVKLLNYIGNKLNNIK
jgi:putative sugar O-methyltransferase